MGLRTSRDNEATKKEVRLAKALLGIAYKEVSERAGIKQSTLYSWLDGLFNFTDSNLERVQKALISLELR